MWNRFCACVALMLLLAVFSCAGDSVEGLPLHVKQIAPGAVRLWVGDHVSSTAVCAIATQKGLVVIDTTDIPKLDQIFRKVIARELGRDDFKYLLITHGHADHTNGNGVYADCEIIAQERVPEMMRENFESQARQIQWRTETTERLKAEIAAGEMTPERKATAEEQLTISSLSLEFLKSAPSPTFPTKTFTGQMALDCGDVTFELYQAGGTHTRSDVFVLVPQKSILFTGDMMADKWLTDTPGCLATFAAQSGEIEDYPVLLKNWQALIERRAEIQQYIPGHWNGELSAAGFQDRLDYLRALLADVPAMAKSGGDLNQFFREYTLKNKFPKLVGSPGITDQGQRISIQHLYQIYSGKLPIGQTLWRMFMHNTFAAEFPALKADILNSPGKYFYFEAELNSLGYYLLNEAKQVEQAIQLFEFVTELFPASWNAFDSLAEAWNAQGDKQKALALYRKSVELNPKNENGVKRIATIESELKH